MADNNLNVFFDLLKVGLWLDVSAQDLLPRESDLVNVDWGEVQRLAEEQSVVGLVASGIDYYKANIPGFKITKADALQFIGQTLQQEQRNQAMDIFIGKIVAKMQEDGVNLVLLKGQGVAQCYAKPELRSCGDVDLLLTEDNYEKAKELLVPVASSLESEYKNTKHLGLTIDPWIVELHGSLRGGISNRVNRTLDEIQKETFAGGDVRTWDNDGVPVSMMGIDNDAIYVFAHFVNHFYKDGLGLRQICDWCRLLWTYKDELDVQRIEKRVRQMGLFSEWRAFSAYAVEYLGMPKEAMPLYSPDRKWVKKAELINKFILRVGNMGHNRDSSYLQKYPFALRKVVSMGRRVGDLINHAWIFPLNSMRFFPKIMINGFAAALRREG